MLFNLLLSTIQAVDTTAKFDCGKKSGPRKVLECATTAGRCLGATQEIFCPISPRIKGEPGWAAVSADRLGPRGEIECVPNENRAPSSRQPRTTDLESIAKAEIVPWAYTFDSFP